MTVELAPHVTSTSLFPLHVKACYISTCDVLSKTPSISKNAYRAHCLEFIAWRRTFVSRYTAIPVDLFLLIFVPWPALVCFCPKNYQTFVLAQPGIDVLLHVPENLQFLTTPSITEFSKIMFSNSCLVLVMNAGAFDILYISHLLPTICR